MSEKPKPAAPEKMVRVRMLTEEKLGKAFDVPESRAKDLVARGMAEIWREPVAQHSDPAVQTRGSSR